jgi:glycosyltransferase involved in cell wall biosynthesis
MDNALHIAVDVHDLPIDTRGIGRYVRTVLAYLIEKKPETTWTLLTHAFPGWTMHGKLARILGTSRFTHARKVPRSADLVWHPWNGTFFQSNVPSIVTMHDAVPFAFPDEDESRRKHAQDPFLRSSNTAKSILTVSQFAKEDIHLRLGYPLSQITVTHLAADPIFASSQRVLPSYLQERLGKKPYILAVGADEPRKNLSTLYRGWEAAFPDEEIALVGTGFERETTPKAIQIKRSQDDGLLSALYRNARIVAFPSVYEGFGLPVLEGMASQVPVIAVKASSVAEVGGDAAYWIHDAYSQDEWSTALRRVNDDDELRNTLIDLGKLHAGKFSWDKTSEQTFAAFKACCKS